MGWTTPRTWTDGEYPTGAIFNTHVRDNLNWLHQPPACAAYRTTFSVADNTDTIPDLTGEYFDTDAMHSTVTQPERVIIKTAGKYLISARAPFAANATGRRSLSVAINAVGVDADFRVSTGATTETTCRVQLCQALVVNDYLVVSLYQNSGGALNAAVELDVIWLAA